MKFSRKRIKLFGLSFMIPILYFVAHKLEKKRAELERAELLRAVRRELGECKRCHAILAARGGHSFYRHLEKDHKIASEESYEIISDVYKRLYAATCTTQKKHNHPPQIKQETL